MRHTKVVQATSPDNSSVDSASFATTKKRFFGFVSRSERWGLTARGWLVLAISFVCAFFTVLAGIHPFLAVTQPLSGDLLIVEGWIPEYAIAKCGDLFIQTGYQEIICVGGPVGGADYPPAEDDTYAYVGANRLIKAGIDPAAIHIVPTNARTRDRTYSSAVAAREWLAKSGFKPETITIATLGPHARRTRLMYEKAFPSQTQIGIVAIDNREYDARRWWKYSEGVKEVVSEGGAYIYARFFFHPHHSDDAKTQN